MTTLYYKLKDSVLRKGMKLAILSKLDGGIHDTLRIEIDGAPRGYIKLGDKKYPLEDGGAEIECTALYEGIHTPVFVLHDCISEAEPFEKEQGIIKRPTLSDALTEEIREAFLAIEERLENAESKIRELSEKISGKLFEFN